MNKDKPTVYNYDITSNYPLLTKEELLKEIRRSTINKEKSNMITKVLDWLRDLFFFGWRKG